MDRLSVGEVARQYRVDEKLAELRLRDIEELEGTMPMQGGLW